MEPINPNPQQASQTPPTSGSPVLVTPTLPDTPPPEPKGEGLRAVLSTLAILIAAPIIALLLTTYIFQSYEVDGPSMETTLDNHDRLLVLKTPKTFASLTGKDYVPNRNEIIIFKTNTIHDGSSDTGGEKQLVKRVIGIPGDRVVVNNGDIRVYNAQFPEGFDPDAGQDHGDSVDVTTGDVDITVEEGEVFVCGDNRSNSLDSRAIGTIPSKDIIGKLVLRLYPLDTIRTF